MKHLGDITRINGTGSCLWASEIEEFPMAVTKVRFSEEQKKTDANRLSEM